ncbi:MAG: hypothetical protein V4604_08300 [Bacteroidota bacterium]
MNHGVTLIFLFWTSLFFGQTNAPSYNFTERVAEVLGDLNKDSLPDKVVVEQDTTAFTWPYRIQVFFAQPDGSFQLIVSSEKLIDAQYPDGRDGYLYGGAFSEVTIVNGLLSVDYGLLRGHYEHEFRFQNSHLELVGFNSVDVSGGQIVIVDFNLFSGVRSKQVYLIGIDKPFLNFTEKVIIRPLPIFEDVVPFEGEWSN